MIEKKSQIDNSIEIPQLGVVNLHFTYECNNQCKFCHSHFYESKVCTLSVHDWKNIISSLEPYCSRINFAGGEPLLFKPLINELIIHCSKIGLISTIITNGEYLDGGWLSTYGKYLSAIGISCDSSSEEIQHKLGRGRGNHVQSTLNKFKLIHNFNSQGGNILPKLNTVVNKFNFHENMNEFVINTGVKRWKVFQLLSIVGENERYSQDLLVTDKEFQQFIDTHQDIKDFGISFVAEQSIEMIDTYLMINPEGRFFSNRNNRYLYSDPILDIGVEEALAQIKFNQDNIANVDRMFI